ncbi:hypothetical protein H9L39_17016, partial [Fusarium oxysporum f. sp. albedinis]
TFCLWCELRKYLGRVDKAPVCKGVNLPQEVSEPTPWREDWSIKLRHGGILRFSFQFYLRPGWRLPQGPFTTPELIYAQLYHILSKELGLHTSCRFRSENHEQPLHHCLGQPESSNDRTFAQEIGQRILDAAHDCMTRLGLRTVQEMICWSGKRSEWVTKGDAPECSVGHPEGDLSVNLPCGHMACMHFENDLAMEAGNGHKCCKSEEPFNAIPFDVNFSWLFIESQ